MCFFLTLPLHKNKPIAKHKVFHRSGYLYLDLVHQSLNSLQPLLPGCLGKTFLDQFPEILPDPGQGSCVSILALASLPLADVSSQAWLACLPGGARVAPPEVAAPQGHPAPQQGQHGHHPPYQQHL